MKTYRDEPIITKFTCSWWIRFGKYVLRIGKPWGHPYRYAWRPLISFSRVYRDIDAALTGKPEEKPDPSDSTYRTFGYGTEEPGFK